MQDNNILIENPTICLHSISTKNEKKKQCFMLKNISGCKFGYFYNYGCKACPLGTFRAYGDLDDRCNPCPDGMSTSHTGSISLKSCEG